VREFRTLLGGGVKGLNGREAAAAGRCEPRPATAQAQDSSCRSRPSQQEAQRPLTAWVRTHPRHRHTQHSALWGKSRLVRSERKKNTQVAGPRGTLTH
jgi:hypothetical protein